VAGGYYDEKLAAGKLRRCYEVASLRVRQYLDAEVGHVRERLRPGDRMLELGCGYGRALGPLAYACGLAVGVDASRDSLLAAREELAGRGNVRLARMDARRLGFTGGAFDAVACIQNGVSAFHVDPLELMAEALRVTRPGGRVLFSTYAAAFWEERLAWFEAQAAEGLLGEIDRERTADGVIFCRDGFTATTFGPGDFRALARRLGVSAELTEVDGSSLFCEIIKGD
jgi:2-polyprenyl-6-hydroxyphenyl methylase/3-demethylubiquinone-9 3-methyltransferase